MAAVDDSLMCAVCLDWLQSPRRLPCHHVYCLQCLRDLVKAVSGRITCPECRRDHVIPNKRVEQFPVDGRLEQLIKNRATPPSTTLQCKHSQPACQDCQQNRALLLESLLRESREFGAEYLTENQIRIRQNLKAQLRRHQENLCNLRDKVKTEIEDMFKELEKRNLTLLSRIEKEEKLLIEDLSKLDQADTICAEQKRLTADIADKVTLTETLVSLRVKLSKQKELMTSLKNVNQNVKTLDVSFKRDKLQLVKLITRYGEFFTTVYYQKDFKLATTLDGSESGSIFSRPWGLTVCPFTDNVYVTDETTVRVYNIDGEYVRHIVTNDMPTGVAIDSKQRVIVASCKENKVKIYNRDLKLIKCFGPNSGRTQFDGPQGVACDSYDRIYVVDRFNHCIRIFASEGTFLFERAERTLQNPFCVRIDKRGKIFVTDFTLGQVVYLSDLFNSRYSKHHKRITGEGDNKLKGPYGLCLDDRRILVADQSSKKIQVYNDDGTHHSTISQPAAAMTSMCGLAVTKSGVIFITDFNGNKIHRLVPELLQ